MTHIESSANRFTRCWVILTLFVLCAHGEYKRRGPIRRKIFVEKPKTQLQIRFPADFPTLDRAIGVKFPLPIYIEEGNHYLGGRLAVHKTDVKLYAGPNFFPVIHGRWMLLPGSTGELSNICFQHEAEAEETCMHILGGNGIAQIHAITDVIDPWRFEDCRVYALDGTSILLSGVGRATFKNCIMGGRDEEKRSLTA